MGHGFTVWNLGGGIRSSAGKYMILPWAAGTVRFRLCVRELSGHGGQPHPQAGHCRRIAQYTTIALAPIRLHMERIQIST